MPYLNISELEPVVKAKSNSVDKYLYIQDKYTMSGSLYVNELPSDNYPEYRLVSLPTFSMNENDSYLKTIFKNIADVKETEIIKGSFYVHQDQLTDIPKYKVINELPFDKELLEELELDL